VAAVGKVDLGLRDVAGLFLIDRSKPNSARWCSMAICGNRLKARRHYQRSRQAAAD
jgi:predicted RNA-binding Zn ribbon-like protein